MRGVSKWGNLRGIKGRRGSITGSPYLPLPSL